jgi:uncharacterized protein (DUF305 family)
MDAPPEHDSDLSFDQLLELDRRAAQREREAAGEPPIGGDRPDDDGGDDDGPVVLPWWQHPVNIVTLLVTAALMAGMIGWMVGDTNSRIAHSQVDTGFLQDMREHHEQAVLMSFIYRTRPDVDPALNTIAREIVVGQSLEVGRMIQLLRDFGESEVNPNDVSMLWMGMSATPGQMPGMATDEELAQLGRLSGRDADELFVELMTAHHRGGIEMADYVTENGRNAEVVEMAAAMASGQRGEIAEMADILS